MIVCICNNVSENEIKTIIKEKPDITIKEIQALNICNQCFKCAYTILEILENDERRI